MSSKRFPFFLRISPQKTFKPSSSHHKISHTPYSSLFYPEEADYRVIASIYPSDSVLISPSKTIKGRALNRKMISKDDLYQYHLNHREDTQTIEFSFIFSELISTKFILQRLSEQSESFPKQNLFIYGKQRTSVASLLLIEIFKMMHELKLSLYSFDYRTKQKRLVKETMKDILVKSINDIKTALKTMKTENKLSMINLDNEEDNKMASSQKESFIIEASYGEMTLNLITMNLQKKSLTDAQVLLQGGFDFLSAFIFNVTEQSFESTEAVYQFHYLYRNQDSLIKLPLVQLLSNNKTPSDMISTLPSRNSNRRLSPIVKTLSIEHLDEVINDSMLFEEKPATSVFYQTPQHTLMAPTPRDLLEEDTSFVEQKADKLSKLLEGEKREKLSLIIEVRCLKKKMETMQLTLKKKNGIIKEMTSEKASLQIENKELKEKNKELAKAINKRDNSHKKHLSNQDFDFSGIEGKISKFESELNGFQKENSNLLQINSKQLIEINTLREEKEHLYAKYQSSKLQIDHLSKKLNQIEANFIKLSAHYSQHKHPLSLCSSEENDEVYKEKENRKRKWLQYELCDKTKPTLEDLDSLN